MKLWSKSALQLGQSYLSGEISPVEVLESVLHHIDEVNPVLNALIYNNRKEALISARKSEQRWRTNQPLSPLDGIPLTIKDNILVKDLPTTWGSRLYENFVPSHDEIAVTRLRLAGAVILGKTNVPEFTLQGFTNNALFGATGNPWDPSLTPGGSSGGAVACVASGMGPLAICTDGGGSIRRPASHTGLVGLKPSPGCVPRNRALPALLGDFETLGPIARTVSDTRILLETISGFDATDRSSYAFQDAKSKFTSPPTHKLRIAYVEKFASFPVDSKITHSVAVAAENLESLGHHISPSEVPFDLELVNRIWGIFGPAGLAWMLCSHLNGLEKISASLQGMAESGAQVSAVEFIEAQDGVQQLRRHFANLFMKYDVIMTPTTAALPWPATESHPEKIDGRDAGPRGHAVFTPFANAGGLPGLSLPAAPSPDGLPIGFQLVGPFGADFQLLDLGLQYENAYPWADRWPDL